MKKYLISIAVVLIFGFYVAYERGVFKRNDNNIAVYPDPVSQVPPAPAPSPTPAPTPTPVASGQYKDGEYTGNVADAFYGPLQVKAVISGGKITDVQFLQYPNDRPESIQVNTASNPILKKEAIATQSAKVDIVSGATQSSEAFQQSLAAALGQAK
ncbi:MAG: FMN-binding protein [Candidatus Doudnabacteria bacterium]